MNWVRLAISLCVYFVTGGCYCQNAKVHKQPIPGKGKNTKGTVSFQKSKSQYLKRRDLVEKPSMEKSKPVFNLFWGKFNSDMWEVKQKRRAEIFFALNNNNNKKGCLFKESIVGAGSGEQQLL